MKGHIEEEFETDVEIDFSKIDEPELDTIIKTIHDRGKYTFRNITVIFSSDIIIDVDSLGYNK